MTNTEMTLTTTTTPAGVFFCWRSVEGARVSRFFRTEAEARRFAPGFPRR